MDTENISEDFEFDENLSDLSDTIKNKQNEGPTLSKLVRDKVLDHAKGYDKQSNIDQGQASDSSKEYVSQETLSSIDTVDQLSIDSSFRISTSYLMDSLKV